MDAAARNRSGVVVPHALKWHQKLAGTWLHAGTRLLTATLRCSWKDESGILREDGPPIIFSLWHNRLALSMLMYHGYVRKQRPRQGLAAMISASKDGGLLAYALKKYDVQPVRGSSSRRGRQALLESTSWIERGYHVAITPDGPRGPRYRVQEGIIMLAQLTGSPIVPFSCAIQWKVCLRSWDRFQVPLPFSRCDIRIGPPVHVAREATANERETRRRELEERMRELTTD
jgi:lysophospholipid acyltransferase (LPLAT)-like uncharacterized protein